MSGFKAPGADGVQLNGKSILVVDDDEDCRESLAEIIRGKGLQVVSVKNGLEALEQLRWGLRPNLILLDLRMDVMTGWDFRKEQKEDPELADIPVVAMTAGHWKGQDLLDFAGCLPKPLDLEELQRELELHCK
jgi:CheY-like chemotaxis protein